MNLVSEKWIPVLNTGGRRQLISLRDAFCQGEQWRDLAVRPHERVALMRLLLCIAHAALEGPSPGEWPLVPKLLPKKAEEYLKKWEGSFDLFDAEKPFLQIAGLKAATKNVKDGDDADGPLVNASKLDFALATGNQSTLFDHAGSLLQRSAALLSPAVSLLTYLCFSPGGRIGRVIWNNHTTEGSSSDAPCAVGSMTHTFWRGGHLLQTLHLNMCDRAHIEQHLACVGAGWGKPVWEQMPKGLDDKAAWNNAAQTYLGRLVPLSRLVLFQREGSLVILGTGPAFPNFNSVKSPFVEEPTATVITRRKGQIEERGILAISQGKALWRELPALVAYRNKDNVGGFWAARIEGQMDIVDRDIIVSCMERKPGKAEVVDTIESVYNIKKGLQTEIGQKLYDRLVKYAEKISYNLNFALNKYNESLGGYSEKFTRKEKAKTIYWTAAEQNLPLLFACVESLGTDNLPDAQKAWAKSLFAAARQAYAAACAPQTPRQHRAYALGLAKLSKPVDDANSSTAASDTSSDTSHEEDDE